ncbi:ABC transporter permease [Phytoactinopolyspora halotolerans]|uniref:ABC transporter permease n=1 Tax=Phytoactinopolyspora halotolerans TaxID=1981512 RepID=A0A6L9S2T5_9ACTN|nr:ABC-2 family transporter protein [Phytoactinopolyspora halotolerans]NED98851.1 ABC transporter permease [Phytoactinopolyspora halotolerans]
MAERLRPYRVLLGSQIRSQTAYRRSFVMELLGSVAIGVLEFTEVYVIFANVEFLGELDFAAAALLFAIANIAFSLADLVVGHVDRIPIYLRMGTLDAFLLRPLPVLAQLITSDISLRRLGRTALGVAVLAVALPLNDIAWSPAKVLLLVVATAAGAAIFAALFVCAAALQFWLVEGSEFANSFTYGGAYASQYPASIFALPVRVLFAFVVPAAFVAYLPTLALLDIPGPPGLPAWLGWCGPLMATAIWGVALLSWRAGVRHYTGTGS